MPAYSHTLEVDAPQSEVFAILEDVERTPQWLDRCTRIDKLSEGPLTLGTQLKYHYRDGRRTGEMAGHVTAHEPDRHVAMRYSDKLMDVTVDFVTDPGSGSAGTRLTHRIDIQGKGIGKVFSPLIRRQLPGQTIGAMEKLKTLAESGS